MNQNTETVVFGGGCFWCTEAVFKPYCQIVISPKLDKLRKRFYQLLKASQP